METEVDAQHSETQTPDAQEATGSQGRLRLDAAFGDATFSAEGDGAVVLRAFEAFKQHDASHHRHRASAKPPATEPQESTRDSEIPDAQERRLESKPLPAFLKEFKLRTNYETALAIAVWASRRPDGQRLFDKDSLGRLWSNSGDKVPANIGAELSRAQGRGWFTKGARGKYELAGYGEEHLETLRQSDKK